MSAVRRRPSLREALRKLGPALILATAVLGPGSLTLHTMAGGRYGYRLLWVPVVATVLMAVYTWLSARVALVTGETLFGLVRARYGTTASRVGGVSAFLAATAFQSGNTAGVGFAADALLGGGVRLWSLVFTLAAGGLVALPGLYRKLEVLVKLIVGAMLLAFVGTLAMVGVRGGEAAAGLVPSFPDAGAAFLTVGMAATTLSLVAAVYQGYLVREKRLSIADLPQQALDSTLGIGILGGISVVVLLTSAGAARVGSEPVLTAQAMALQLEPIAGPLAFLLFLLGFFFAAFSSQVINPLIGATLLADSMGHDAAMDNAPVKRWTALILAVGLLPVLIYSGSPVELLQAAQAVAVVALPVLGFFVLALAHDRGLMGPHVARGWVTGVALLGYLAVIAVALNYLRQLLGL